MPTTTRNRDDRYASSYDSYDSDTSGSRNTTNALIAGAVGFGLGLLAVAGRKAAVQA